MKRVRKHLIGLLVFTMILASSPAVLATGLADSKGAELSAEELDKAIIISIIFFYTWMFIPGYTPKRIIPICVSSSVFALLLLVNFTYQIYNNRVHSIFADGSSFVSLCFRDFYIF